MFSYVEINKFVSSFYNDFMNMIDLKLFYSLILYQTHHHL